MNTNTPKFKTREEALESRAHYTDQCRNILKVLLIANEANQALYAGCFTIPEGGYDEGLLRMFHQCPVLVKSGSAFCSGCQMQLKLDL